MKKLLVATSLLHIAAISWAAPSQQQPHRNSNTTYDQRQVGKYNIHFNIKDVSIISLGTDDIIDHIGDTDSYADYYDYEDSEYTVNPATADLSGKPTTKKPNVTQPIQPSIEGLRLNFSSVTTTSTDSPIVKPQTLIFIHDKPSHQNDTLSDEKTESSSIKYQPDEIPVQVIVEPLLKPKTRPSMKSRLSNRQVNRKIIESDDGDGDEEIRPRRRRAQIRARIRSRRAQNRLLSRNGNSNGCERGEIRDSQGGCRVRRSGMSGFLDFLTKFLPQRE